VAKKPLILYNKLMSKALRGLLKPKDKISKKQLAVYAVILAVVGGAILLITHAAPNPNLPGDLNSDNTVNASDLSLLLTNYNTTNSAADINGDGHVNVLDLSILLGHYGQSVTVTTSGGTPGIGVLAYGGNLKYVLNLNGYSMVIGSSYSSDSSLLQSTAGRGLTYFAGSDVNTTYSTGVPYSQASANGWLLYCGTILCVNKGFANDYIGDVGSSGYQQAFITNVENYLAAHPGTDGIFIDDVLYTATGLIGSYPNKYPSLSTWSSAQVSFVKAVYSALHSKGYYVALNASGYVPGDANSNTSANEQTFWKMVGPYSDGLMNEWYDETASGITTAQLRSTGTAWYQEFDSWQQIIPLIQSMGKDFIALTKQTCTNTTAMTYGKASFLLEWNGGGGAYIYTCGGSTDPTNTAWTKNIGTPSAAKVQVGVGWMRSYTKGTVLVNPSPTASQTFTVNGTSYTLSPTTARIL
jgi:hypothetical protein